MRTVLITSGEKQQVVLQPENTKEHRILQMLLDGEKEVTVQGSPVSVDGHGNITAVQRAQFYDEHRAHPMPVMVQVQPAAPVDAVKAPQRNPEVLVLTRQELGAVIRMMHAKSAGIDPLEATTIADRILELAEKDKDKFMSALEELRNMGGWMEEPNPYL